MANGWMKTLQCKSTAANDIHDHHDIHRRRRHRHRRSNPKNHHMLLSNATNCGNTIQNLKDVVETEIAKCKKTKPIKQPQTLTPPSKEPAVSRKVNAGSKESNRHKGIISCSSLLLRSMDSCFPALTELHSSHPSRKVVEIIFRTSWGSKNFPGRVEMVFKVQNYARTVALFEEYREVLKSRARSHGGGEDHARCVADGNEVMKFHCLGATTREVYEDGGLCGFHGGKKNLIRTFAETGGAHESDGGGRGWKAMLVCRVIAGRVRKQLKFDSWVEDRVEYDSVSGANGEFLVLDSRALLPCFLVIYKL